MLKSAQRDYLEALSHRDRLDLGAVYTPSHLVDFILKTAGCNGDSSIANASILDPACGGGAFLERLVYARAKAIRAHGSQQFRARLLRSIRSTLFGIDIDPQACRLARRAVRDVIREIAPGRLPPRFFFENIICADFLTSPLVAKLPPMRHGGFSYVIGNPPYVSATRIAGHYKTDLRDRFVSSSGRLDLYTVFIERALDLLNKRGRLAFITPDKFLATRSASALREILLERTAIRTFAIFRSHKVFANAATVPCVSVFERGGTAGNINVLTCVDDKSKIEVTSRTKVRQAELSGAPWHFVAPGDLTLAARLKTSHPTLANSTQRISAGLATGRDGIFVFPAGSQPDVEPELRYPAVRGRDIAPYHFRKPDIEILLPFKFVKGKSPQLIDLRDFPGAGSYLKRHRAELEGRHCVRVWQKSWYDFHDQPPCDLSSVTKILVPDVATENRFAIDAGQYVPLHSAYYAVPKAGVDPYYLLGLLNSAVSTYLVRLYAPLVKDGFARYRQQYLNGLPIPHCPNRTQKQIATAAMDGDATLVNELVYSLFGVSRPERRRIEGLAKGFG